MILYLSIVLPVMLLVIGARLMSRAVEEEHLLVLYWKEHGLWIFERGGSGRYERLALVALPVALLRYVWRTWHPKPVPVRLPKRAAAADTS